MKPAREVEFEVLGKEPPRPATRPAGHLGDDPMVAFVAKLMDNVFTVPGTKIRFGLDPILGLLPGLGDTATALVSAMLIAKSASYGVPKIVLARMAGNVLLNTGLGALPVVGDLFSVWFKSNARNYDLLRRHAGAARKATTRDWLFVGGLIAIIVLVLALVVIGAVTLLGKLFGAAMPSAALG